MTIAEKMRRVYILLRWYDRSKRWLAEHTDQEMPAEDIKLLLELELEMRELQKKSNEENAKKKKRKKCAKKVDTTC